jgi:hypothetical protein
MRCQTCGAWEWDFSFSSQIGVDTWVSLSITQALANRLDVKTLLGLGVLDVSTRYCECNDQWFSGLETRA